MSDFEFNKGKHVHSAFNSGSSFALKQSRAELMLKHFRSKLLKNNKQLQQDINSLKTNGYVILRNLITDKKILSNTLKESQRLLKDIPYGRNIFEGRLTRRVHNLTSKSRVFDQFVLHPRLLPILDYYLYPNHLLSILQLIEINPKSNAQPLHYDSQSLYNIQRPRVDFPMQLAFFWALDNNYTPENGATIIYPGSHLWNKDRTPNKNDKKVSFTLNQGDAICILGTLWHGGGKHLGKNNNSRLILTSQHVQPFIRQIENLMLATPYDIIDKLPKRLQVMIGYSVHFPFYGSVDGVHPKKALPKLLQRYSKL
eukprot:542769_1